MRRGLKLFPPAFSAPNGANLLKHRRVTRQYAVTRGAAAHSPFTEETVSERDAASL